MAKVVDPSQELRFSRTAQASIFAIIGSVFITTGIILVAVIWTVHQGGWSMDELPFPLWVSFIPWFFAVGCFLMIWHCLRHPFLILSPAGVEIFPFWRPIKNFNIIPWGAIADLDINKKSLTLHHNKEHTGGVVLSLAPLSKKSRILLMQAVKGVMDKRNS